MKLTKRLLAMLLLVCMVFSMLPAIALTASAATQTLSFSFTSCPSGWPSGSSSSANTKTYTVGGTAYTFSLGANVYYNTSKYLMLKSTTYLGLPAIDGYKLTKVVAKNSSGCSIKTKVAVSSNTTGTTVTGGSAQTWSTTSSTYTYNLSNTSANTMYYLYITSANSQIVSLDLTYESTAPSKTLSSIAVSSNHRTFTVGDTFVKETVTATYSDNTTADVTNSATFSGYNMSSADTQTVTASYTEGGVTKTATYQITVAAPTPYTLTYSVNGDTSVFSSGTITSGSSVSLPANVTAPTGYTFAGWVASAIGTETTTAPTVLTGSYTMPAADTTLYAVYTRTEGGSGGSSTYQLVTSASDLVAGSSIVIAAKDYNYAISTTQNDNNRGQASITKSGNTITLGTGVSEFTLEAGTTTGTYSFKDSNGYLYAASSSSNYLRSESSKSGNSSWTISISSGTASVTANGSNSRKVMQYNQSSSLFACYSSASQKALALYQKTGSSGTTYYTTSPVVAAKYDIIVDDDIDNGIIYFGDLEESGSFEAGTTLTLDNEADSGYQFDGYVLTNADTDEDVTATYISGNTLTMPAFDVILSGSFSLIPANVYTVTTSSNAGGSISSNKNSAEEGDSVTITINPTTHYHLTSLTVDGSQVTVSGNSYTFTMPGHNVAVAATFAEDAKYTVTVDSEIENGTVTVSKSADIYAGETITLTATPAAHYTFGAWQITPSVTVSGNAFTMPASNVTVSATFNENPKATVTYSVIGDTTAIASVTGYVGTQITLPDTVTVEGLDEDYSFAGWVASAISTEDTTAPTVLTGSYTIPAANTTLYALFTRTEEVQGGGSSDYVKVTATSDLTDGQYLIVYESGSVALDSSLATIDAVEDTIDVTISNNTIPSNTTTDNSAFTFTASNGSFLGTNGKYIGHTGSKNTLDTSTSAMSNTVSIDADGNAVINGGGSYVLRYNDTSGQDRFRYYTGTQQPIQLYKKGTGTTYYTTAPVTEGPTYSITVTQSANGTLSADKATAHEGDTVNLTATPNAHYSFNGWQCTAGGATISGNTFVMPANDVTITGTFSENTKYTVTYYDKDGSMKATEQVYAGETPASVPAIEAPNGYVFKGWYGTTYALNAAEPTYVSTSAPITGNTEFHAVYARLAAGSSPYFKLSMVVDNTTYYVGERVSEKTWLDYPTDAADAAEFGYDVVNGKAYLYYLSGDTKNYIYNTASDTSLSFSTTLPSGSTGFEYWTVEEDGSTIAFKNGTGTRYLAFNSDRFSTYTPTATQYPCEFTKIGGPSYDSYTTDPARIAPTLTAVDDTVIFDRDKALTFNVLTNDDLDYLDATGVTVTVTGTLPTGVVNNNDGTFTFTPSGMQSADITFTYTITDKADSTNVSESATVTLKPASIVYYDESDSDVFSFVQKTTPEGEWQDGGWTSVTDSRFGNLADALAAEQNGEFVMYSGGSAKKATVSAQNASKNYGVQFSFAGTGFDLVAATTGSSGTALITVKQDGTTIKTALVDTYRGYTYNEEEQTVYVLKQVDRYKLDEETGKYVKYVDGAVITEYTYIRDKDAEGGYRENTTWYSGEPGTVKTDLDEFTEDLTGASSCILVKVKTNWIPNNGQNASDGNFYQIPIFRMMGLSYGSYDVTITVAYNALFDHDGDGSYEFIFDGVNIHDPVADRVDYKYIDLRQSIIDSNSSFGSVEIAPCDHENKTDWTFYSAASGNATGEALNRGSFVKRCNVCNEIADTAYFNITTSATPTTIGLTGTSTLSYTLTSDNADVQTILNGLTFTATWTTDDSTVIRCSNGVATAQNKEGSTYAKLGLKVGDVQYASVIKSPTITVSNSQPGGYTATFHVPAGAAAPAALTGASITLPAAVAAPASCDAHTYNFAGWVKSAVAYDDTAPDASDILAAGATDTLTANTDFYALYTYQAGGSGGEAGYYLATETPAVGDKVIIAFKNGDDYYALPNANKASGASIAGTEITVSNGCATAIDSVIFNVVSKDGATALESKAASGNWIGLNSGNKISCNGWGDTKRIGFTAGATEGTYKIEGTSAGNNLDRGLVAYNGTSFRSDDNGGDDLYIFVYNEGGSGGSATYYTTNPGHKVVDTESATTPTCTVDGYTGDVICSECGMKLEDGDAIPALGHNYAITSDPGELNTTYTCSVCHDSYIEYYEYAVSYVLQPGVEISGGSRGEGANVNRITLPDEADIPDTYDAQTYTLVGWANATSADGTTNPSTYATGAVVNINADTTFYPVYSYGGGSGTQEAGYYLADSVPTVGNEIIIAFKSGDTYYALPNGNKSSSASIAAETLTVSNGKATATSTNTFELITNSGYMGIKSTEAANYLGFNSDKISMNGWGDTKYAAISAASDGMFTIYSSNNSPRGLSYSGTNFTVANAGGSPVYIFTYTEGGTGGGTTTYTFELQALEDSYSVTLNPTMLRMDVESTANLTATLYNNLRPVEAESVSFSSSNNSIVSVDASTGALTAGNTAGTAVVTATVTAPDDTTYTATCTVTVREKSNSITVNYIGSATGKVYNWGTRGTVATFLTAPTTSYYTGSYSYETLFAMSGDSGSGTDFYSSALGTAIHNMLVNKQTTQTSYDGTRSLYAYTDCIESDTAHVSGYYTGKTLSSTWDSGATWNREHVWPSSKCINTNHGADGADIMMLRPEAASDNSGRGNTAFGESSGYYNPDAKYPNKAANVRGDVARNVLYTLMRWGNTTKFYGTNGVIENRNILIKWMNEDPVDTWELARNDAAQRITGVRNIFVDYPELAYKLLGATMPNNYSTPSSSGVVAEATYSATRPANYEPVTEGSGSTPNSTTRSASAHRAAPTVGTITGAVVIDGMGDTTSLAAYEENGPKYGVYLAPGQALVFTLNSEETVEKPTKLQIGAKALNGRAAKLDVLNVGQLVTPMLEKSIASATEQYYDLDVSELGWNGTSSDVIVLYNDGEGILDVTQLRYPTTDGTLTLNVSEVAAKNAAKMLRIVYGIPETAPDPIEPTDLGLNFKSAALVLNSDISMNFYVEEAVLNSAKNVYAVFTKALYNKAGEITGYEEKTVTEITQSERGYAFRFDGINPAEMGSTVTATLHGCRDGELITGKTVNYSVLTYVNNMFANSDDASFNTLLADLVNYGAAAQTYVSYNTAKPVTAGVSADLLTYATTAAPALSDCTRFVKNDAASVVFTAASLSLRDKVTVRYALDASGYEGSVNGLALHITYVDIDGEKTEAVIPGSSFEQSNDKYLVSFSCLNAVQMRTVLHASVYAGDTCVSDTLDYSIESYASAMAGGGNALANLVLAMMRYGDSAEECFRK